MGGSRVIRTGRGRQRAAQSDERIRAHAGGCLPKPVPVGEKPHHPTETQTIAGPVRFDGDPADIFVGGVLQSRSPSRIG